MKSAARPSSSCAQASAYSKCLYFDEHRKTELDCNQCMKVSTMLFGHYDALCGLDSCGTDTWQRLADLIDRPSENIERPR